MPIPVSCPTCLARVNAPDAAAGKTVKCPKCKQPMVIPGGAAEPAGASPFDFTAPVPPPPSAPSSPVATSGRKRPAAEQPMDLDDAEPPPSRKPGRGPTRRRNEDDEDDDRPRGRGRKPAKAGPPLGLIIGIAAVVGLLAIGGAGLGVYYAFFNKSKDDTADGGGGGGGGGSGGSKAPVPAGWKEFTAKADGFKAYFPAEPRSKPDTGPGDLKKVKATVYMAANPQSKQMAVAAVFKLSDIPAAERDGIVDRVVREAAKEDGGKEVSRRSATLGGQPATEVVMEMPSIRKSDERPQLVARVMKTESRVYMVGVGGLDGKVPDDVAKGFFDNFEITAAK